MILNGLACEVFCVKDPDNEDFVFTPNTIDECFVREYTFFSFDYATQYHLDSRYSVLSSGGEDFVINERYSSLIQRIKKIMFTNIN